MLLVDAATIPEGPNLETGPLVLYIAATFPDPSRRAPGSADKVTGGSIGKPESTEFITCKASERLA